MTTWTLSELESNTDCSKTIVVDVGGALFSYTKGQIPCVIVDSGASVPIPFYGWFDPSSENL